MLALASHRRWLGAAVLSVFATALFGCGGGGGGGSSAPSVSISAQPQNVTANDGAAATFSVTATGSSPFTYQWRRNGVDIPSATASTYSIPAVVYSTDNGAKFNVIVNGTGGSTIASNQATLTVNAVAPTVGPAGITPPSVPAGNPVTLTATVSGGTAPLTYQWQKNGTDIPGATNLTYTTGAMSLADNNAIFQLVVTNAVTSVTSAPATLTVTSAAPSITHVPLSQSVLAGATATFEVGATGSGPLHFQWYKEGSPIPGATTFRYVTPATILSDDGKKFTVIVSNASGSTAPSPAPPSPPAVLTVGPNIIAPTILTDPMSQTALVGSAASFTVVASGTQPLSYQWFRGATAVPGATNPTFTLSPVAKLNDQDSYKVTVSNSQGTATSSAAVLTVTSPATKIDLIAGRLGGPGTLDGTGGAARLSSPEAIAIDAAGNVYVADTFNSTIRIVSLDGVVKTIAGAPGKPGYADGAGGSAQFNFPQGIAIDNSNGTIYVADTSNHVIRKIDNSGQVSLLAGTVGVAGTADGTGAAAGFAFPQGLATDAAGNVYVADSGNHTIRLITPAGVVSTIAGTAGTKGATDGSVATALFNHPDDVVVDAGGIIYVADTDNNTIRSITGGVVNTIAGTASVTGNWHDGTGGAAQFDHPHGLSIDSAGNVLVADTFNATVRKVTPGGAVTTVAGTAYTTGSADKNGASASFSGLWDVVADAVGNIYVADFANDTVRRIDPAATVTTLAGSAPQPGSTDTTGGLAQFSGPQAAAADSAGNIYVADTANSTIRKISTTGAVSTLATGFNAPKGVAVDSSGNVYVSDTGNATIRMVTAGGVVSTLAGSAGVAGNQDGTGASAQFNAPQGISVDASGNVFVADTGNSTIRKIAAGGVVTTLAGSAGVTGTANGAGAAARFNAPQGLAIDGAGNLYVADTNNYTIRVVTSAGAVSTLAGSAGAAGNSDGVGSGARFNVPTGLAVDSGGNVYVMDSLYSIIRKVTPAGTVTTVAGTPGAHGVKLGGLPGSFNSPVGIAILPGAGANLIVPDKGENAVLLVVAP